MTTNKMVNFALREFIAQDMLALKRELEESLKALNRARQSDPDFESAIDAAVQAEVRIKDDPADGTIDVAAPGSATATVRGFLSA